MLAWTHNTPVMAMEAEKSTRGAPPWFLHGKALLLVLTKADVLCISLQVFAEEN